MLDQKINNNNIHSFGEICESGCEINVKTNEACKEPTVRVRSH